MTRLVFELTHKADQGRPIVQLVETVELQGVQVPAGYRSDFASIPTPLRPIFPVFGRSAKAAVLHDYLCYLGADRRSRSRAFLRQMLADHVPSWQAWAQYFAVRFWPGSETEVLETPRGAPREPRSR